MKHKKRVIEYSIIALLFIFILSSIFFIHYITGKAVSGVVAEAGKVTEVNASESRVWTGIYGDITEGQNSSVVVEGERTSLLNLDLDLEFCAGTNFYASPQSIAQKPGGGFFNALTAGISQELTDFMNITNSSVQRGQLVFNETVTFSINSRSLDLPAYRLEGSTTNNYTVGLLKNGSSFVFVSTFESGRTAFDGVARDYEFMLPSPIENNITYSFFQEECPSVAAAPPLISGGGGARRRAQISPFIIRPEIEDEKKLKTRIDLEKPECVPSYYCDEWKDCENSVRRRNCEILNLCPDVQFKLPHQKESCGEQLPLQPAIDQPLQIKNYLSTLFTILFLACLLFAFFELRKKANELG